MSKHHVLIIDPCCPKPYGPRDLDKGGLGGTESTVVRVAEGLQMPVVVAQHNRTDLIESASGTLYRSLKTSDFAAPWRSVVILRDPRAAIALKRQFDRSMPTFLWLHDAIPANFGIFAKELADLNITCVCVSEWHKTQLVEAFRAQRSLFVYPKIRIVHNPIDNDLMADKTPIDENKLVFFSSPHKGLKQTLELYKRAKELEPRFKLVVANPGYYEDMDTKQYPDVTNWGVLSHKEVMDEVRSALCVFYPNTVFPETFGLVYAEANAVGTPVLCHNFGAAGEILSNPDVQMVDCKDPYKVLNRLLSWRDGSRPRVWAKEAYRLNTVLKDWRDVL